MCSNRDLNANRDWDLPITIAAVDKILTEIVRSAARLCRGRPRAFLLFDRINCFCCYTVGTTADNSSVLSFHS